MYHVRNWYNRKSTIFFDSYRLQNGKLFCPRCWIIRIRSVNVKILPFAPKIWSWHVQVEYGENMKVKKKWKCYYFKNTGTVWPSRTCSKPVFQKLRSSTYEDPSSDKLRDKSYCNPSLGSKNTFGPTGLSQVIKKIWWMVLYSQKLRVSEMRIQLYQKKRWISTSKNRTQ